MEQPVTGYCKSEADAAKAYDACGKPVNFPARDGDVGPPQDIVMDDPVSGSGSDDSDHQVRPSHPSPFPAKRCMSAKNSRTNNSLRILPHILPFVADGRCWPCRRRRTSCLCESCLCKRRRRPGAPPPFSPAPRNDACQPKNKSRTHTSLTHLSRTSSPSSQVDDAVEDGPINRIRRGSSRRSRHQGVSWDAQKSRWRMQFRRKGHKRVSSHHDSEVEAAKAYDVQRLAHGMSRVNFPTDVSDRAQPAAPRQRSEHHDVSLPAHDGDDQVRPPPPLSPAPVKRCMSAKNSRTAQFLRLRISVAHSLLRSRWTMLAMPPPPTTTTAQRDVLLRRWMSDSIPAVPSAPQRMAVRSFSTNVLGSVRITSSSGTRPLLLLRLLPVQTILRRLVVSLASGLTSRSMPLCGPYKGTARRAG